MYRSVHSRSTITYRHHRPPEPDPKPTRKPANFIIELHPNPTLKRRKITVEFLAEKCVNRPDSFFATDRGPVAGRLFFTEWTAALSAYVTIWESRFDKEHTLSPVLIPNVVVPSDVDELNEKMRPLFVCKIREMMGSEEVRRCEEKVRELEGEIRRLSELYKRKFTKLDQFVMMEKVRKGLVVEKRLVVKRVEEFRVGLRCLLRHVERLGEGGGEGSSEEEGEEEDGDGDGDDGVPVFRFGEKGERGVDWRRVYGFMMRECKRLVDGLPVFAYRREFLDFVCFQQIMVLIGETGSGKSTQLIQFLADSGIVAGGSIICTQPRKIAALSLADRVREECQDCYGNSAINCHSSYSSMRQFEGDLIYMTDHCLLQHCMNDRNLQGVSCILVDEAHERSLNTDLLLALLKQLLPSRPDLRLIIMSATADAKQLSDYFYGCRMFTVVGRTFPVDVKYVPCLSEGISQSAALNAANIAPYVYETVRVATEIHKTEQAGSILAFLTSAMEVEWACERLQAPNAEPLALHGRLSPEEQSRVFQDYPGRRKVIFTTNVAETSLTIPGVRFVVDSGMAKESMFDPGSGMNVLKICWISKSSADQRAGRAGRTEPGCCYRLYSRDDFHTMASQREPEIRRVHLGVAVLKIVALGITSVQEFDFVDNPSPEAIDMAMRNLAQLGAIRFVNGDVKLTETGRKLVKLGIEPRLGKLILGCCDERLGKEGLVLAAVMANSSSIFCRVGNFTDKLKADRLKVPFCHRDGDLFTLLSVYKAWEGMPLDKRNKWCWENSINAKSMRRCHVAVSELEMCLKSELRAIVPSYWQWKPELTTEHDKKLKKAILAALAENTAMYSGSDQLGYKVALTGQHVRLHPSCSLLMFNLKPSWVVFGEILSVSDQYLVCVTAFDKDFLNVLDPPPLFDAVEMETQKLVATTLSGYGKTLLKKFCGRFNNGLLSLVSRIRRVCGDERIGIDVDVDSNQVRLSAMSHDIDKVSVYVKEALDCERRWLQNECLELCLYHGGPGISPFALFGSGAEVKHLEIDKRCLSVDVFFPSVGAVDDKELIKLIEGYASGICGIHKSISHYQETEEKEKWGSVTFQTPEAANQAVDLDGTDFNGLVLNVKLSGKTYGIDKAFSYPAVKARLSWPRRFSRGFAIVKCDIHEVDMMISQLHNLKVGERYVQCAASTKYPDSVVLSGIDKEACESEILPVLRSATDCRILDFFLVRGDAVDNPPSSSCEEALFREISVFMPKGSPQVNACRVQVFTPEPKDAFIKALIIFDGRLHLEAAKALEQIEGKVLPGLRSWQKIQCQRLFHTSVSCPAPVYSVIKKEVDSLVSKFNRQRGVECVVERNSNGSRRVKISATATKTVAELRRPFEELMKGRTIAHASLTPTVLQLLFSRDGILLMKSLHREMGVYLFWDRQSLSVRVFGPSNKTITAEETFIQRLLNLHGNKQLEVHLRGVSLPYDLMKEVVKKYGPDLSGLKEKVPEAEFTLNTRRHVISISGNKEAKLKVEDFVNEIAQTSNLSTDSTSGEIACPICLCEVEDEYQLESCMHVFCRSCLVEQCESAIKNHDSFPLCCTHQGCGVPLWVVDLKSLLSTEKLDELFMASMGAFVASSGGKYRFCPSPDCPSIYRVAGPDNSGDPFVCGACYAETCTRCHLEYHPYLTCERYKMFKEHPDASLEEWVKGKEEYVKKCPVCGHTIEKAEGCNHIECRCGKHICWVCLEKFLSSEDCYGHLRAVHQGFV